MGWSGVEWGGIKGWVGCIGWSGAGWVEKSGRGRVE